MDPEEKELPTPKLALTRFTNLTGMHGVPNIAVARSLFRRICWILLTLTMTGVCLWQLVEAVQTLISFPVSTTVSFIYASPMNFPAVTVCNLNPVRYGQLAKYKSNKFVDDMLKTVGSQSSGGPSTFSSFSSGGTSWDSRDQTNRRQDYSDASTVFKDLSAVNNGLANNLSYSISEILIDCSFNGKNCVPNHFVRFRSPRYGNCFIFNSGKLANGSDASIRTVKKSGSQNGLELTLYTDQDDYLPNVITNSGFKVLIQDRNIPPLPESSGYEVTPGFQTSFGLRTTIYERAKSPYGTCLNFTKAQNASMNHLVDQLPLTSPSIEVCLQVCEQLLIIDQCGCNTYLDGLTRSSPYKSKNATVAVRACNVKDTSTDAQCVQKVAQTSSKKCRQSLCKNEECVVVKYDVTPSMSLWPAEQAFSTLLQSVQSHPERSLVQNLVNVTQAKMRDFIYKNFVKVIIYFESLEIEYVKTEASYTALSFISDLGGITGLWLGFSILTFFELIEFIIDLFIALFYCNKVKELDNKVDTENISMDDNVLPLEYHTEFSRPSRREALKDKA